MRSNNEQRNYKDAMKILIDLYNLVRDIDEHSYFTEQVIRLVARLFHKTIPNFSPCIFLSDENLYYFRYRTAMEQITLAHQGSKSDTFQQFIKTIDALKKDIQNDIYDFFIITEHAHEAHAYKKSKMTNYKNLLDEFSTHRKGFRNYQWMNFDNYENRHELAYLKGDVDCTITPYRVRQHDTGFDIETFKDYTSLVDLMDIDEDYKKKLKREPYFSPPKPDEGDINDHTEKTQDYNKLILEDLNILPPYYEVFHVLFKADSHFCKSLYKQDSIRYISSPGHSELNTDFFDVIKYILVKYVSLFGSFERIRVCKNCGKLFYRKKYGYGIFCNNRCRVNYDVGLEPKDIFNCRARQNRWLERNLYQGDTMLKDDCKKCQNQPFGENKLKGGTCKIMLDKNMTALSKIIKKK